MMDTILRIYSDGQKKFTVTLASGKKISVSEDILVKYQLHKEMEISQEMLEKIKKEMQADEGYQAALRYLSYQLRSVFEIKKYLKEREVPKYEIENIIVRLKDLKLLDDQQYSESYVRTSIRTSDKGPEVVRQQLQKRGLSEEDIQHGLLLFTSEEEEKLAAVVANKLVKHYRQKSYKEMLQKVKLNLMQKGFSREAVTDAVGKLEVERNSEDEWDLLVKQGEKLWNKNSKLALKTRKLKVQQSLYQKGFDYGLIQEFVNEKEEEALLEE